MTSQNSQVGESSCSLSSKLRTPPSPCLGPPETLVVLQPESSTSLKSTHPVVTSLPFSMWPWSSFKRSVVVIVILFMHENQKNMHSFSKVLQRTPGLSWDFWSQRGGRLLCYWLWAQSGWLQFQCGGRPRIWALGTKQAHSQPTVGLQGSPCSPYRLRMGNGWNPLNLKSWEAMDHQGTGNWDCPVKIEPWNSWFMIAVEGQGGSTPFLFHSSLDASLFSNGKTLDASVKFSRPRERHPTLTVSVPVWKRMSKGRCKTLRRQWPFWLGCTQRSFSIEAKRRVDSQTGGKQARERQHTKQATAKAAVWTQGMCAAYHIHQGCVCTILILS